MKLYTKKYQIKLPFTMNGKVSTKETTGVLLALTTNSVTNNSNNSSTNNSKAAITCLPPVEVLKLGQPKDDFCPFLFLKKEWGIELPNQEIIKTKIHKIFDNSLSAYKGFKNIVTLNLVLGLYLAKNNTDAFKAQLFDFSKSNITKAQAHKLYSIDLQTKNNTGDGQATNLHPNDVLKIKLKHSLPLELKRLKDLKQTSNQLRVDANSIYTLTDFTNLNSKELQWLDQNITFFEDPCKSFDECIKLQDLLKHCKVALDFIDFKTKDLNLIKALVWKPLMQNPKVVIENSSTECSLLITSLMDHPVGNFQAEFWAHWISTKANYNFYGTGLHTYKNYLNKDELFLDFDPKKVFWLVEHDFSFWTEV